MACPHKDFFTASLGFALLSAPDADRRGCQVGRRGDTAATPSDSRTGPLPGLCFPLERRGFPPLPRRVSPSLP